MTKATTSVLTGVAVAALAAAGAAAVVRHRQGQAPHPDERARLDELESRLHDIGATGRSVKATVVDRVLEDLHRNRGISVAQLRQWIAGLRDGTMSAEQASVAESDFDALERQADERGA